MTQPNTHKPQKRVLFSKNQQRKLEQLKREIEAEKREEKRHAPRNT